MSTTTDLTVLKINYLTQAQYDSAKSQGTLEANEIYMTPVSNPGVEDVEVDGVSVVTDGVAEITMPTVPTKVSQLQNDAGYLTSYTETDPTVPAWAKASSKPSYTASEVGAVPTSRKVNGKALTADITLSASDVSALPASTSIPSKVSDLQNDAGYITGYTETDPVFSASAASGITASHISQWNGITIGDYTEGLVDTIAHGYTSLPNNGMARSVSLLVNGGMFVGFMYRYSDTYGGGSLVKYDGTSCNVFIDNGTVSVKYDGVLVVSVASFSSLPQTASNSAITANHVCIKAELGTPSAQTGDWTVTTSNGSLTISGSISGSTTATLYLARKEN